MVTLTNIKSQKLRKSFPSNTFESLYSHNFAETMNELKKCKFCFIENNLTEREKNADLHQYVMFLINDYS